MVQRFFANHRRGSARFAERSCKANSARTNMTAKESKECELVFSLRCKSLQRLAPIFGASCPLQPIRSQQRARKKILPTSRRDACAGDQSLLSTHLHHCCRPAPRSTVGNLSKERRFYPFDRGPASEIHSLKKHHPGRLGECHVERKLLHALSEQ